MQYTEPQVSGRVGRLWVVGSPRSRENVESHLKRIMEVEGLEADLARGFGKML